MSDPRLASRLKEVRTGAGLTQAELAERAGVSRKTVNTVENFEAPFSVIENRPMPHFVVSA